MRKNYKITLIAATLALSITVLSTALTPKKIETTDKGQGNSYIASATADATINSAALLKKGYKLVWFDEFTSSSIDSTKWCTDKPRMSGTAEHTISNAAWAISQSNGNLRLNAVYNEWYDETATSGFTSFKYVAPYTVSTEGKMSYKYGYLEIRAKVPFKEGCWPSLWLRSHHATDKRENPNFEVELDVFEVFGSKDTLASNMHQQKFNGDIGASYMTTGSSINKEEAYTFSKSTNLSNEYHTYGFAWEPDYMAVYVDGVKQCEWQINKFALLSYGLQPDVSGFDTTMNVLFNNHLFTKNSEYLPSSDNIIENYESNLPSEYAIDYIRLFQRDDGVSKLIVGR